MKIRQHSTPHKAAKNRSLKIEDNGDVSTLLQKGGRKFLTALKQKAIRINNSWYRVLAIDKRRFIDAVIQTVERINSPLLLKILTPYTERLLQAIGGTRALIGHLSYGMQSYGRSSAQRISLIAKKWGNNSAAKWANDEGFIRFLTVIDMNDLPIFKVSTKL